MNIPAVVAVTAVTAAGLSSGRMAEGPPPGFTGGFGEGSCVVCHLGSDVNAYGGRAVLQGLPEAYVPGAAYPLVIVLEAEETEVAGFQLSARYADGTQRGADAGLLAPVDDRTELSDSAGVTYLHQSRLGSATADRSGSSWDVVWTAPASDQPVSLNLAANSGNGDNSPLGDLVYTHEIVVPPTH